MPWLPTEIQTILSDFLVYFSNPVSQDALILTIGAILCTRSRTVASCLRVMGLGEDEHFTNYHRVLNRSHWDIRVSAKIMLGLLITLTPECVPLVIAIDETIERRNGEKIKARGCCRDAVRSSSEHVVRCFGLKWICMMLIVPLPWAKRPWAVPFLTVLAPSKACNEAEGRRHKTTVDWARQMVMQARRWIKDRAIVLVGDGAYAAVSFALCCVGLPGSVTLISRLRPDANLYDEPPPDQPGKRGPKPKKGKKQTRPEDRVSDPSTHWTPIKVLWYDGVMRTLEIFCGVSLWYTPGLPPVRRVGVISPVPANIYLHYVTDEWFENVVAEHCRGQVYLCRYADDFVCAFQYQDDAERFYRVLGKRLEKFGLSTAEEKTRIIRFTRLHPEDRNCFEFLGFEFRRGTDRKGRPSDMWLK